MTYDLTLGVLKKSGRCFTPSGIDTSDAVPYFALRILLLPTASSHPVALEFALGVPAHS